MNIIFLNDLHFKFCQKYISYITYLNHENAWNTMIIVFRYFNIPLLSIILKITVITILCHIVCAHVLKLQHTSAHV